MPGRQANPGYYRYGFNGMEKDDELKGSGNSYDFGARMYDSRLGRWLAIDPLASKYPSNAPYSFAANSPIAFLDPNGKENVIYLVILPEASAKLTIEQKEEIVKKANAILQGALGVNTQVVLYEGSDPFDPSNIDNTDSYLVLGMKEELIEETYKEPLNQATRKGVASDAKGLNKNHPEQSDATRIKGVLNQGGLIQLEGVEGFAEMTGENVDDVIAFLVVHGAVHNAFPGGDEGGHVGSTIIACGAEIVNTITGRSVIDEATGVIYGSKQDTGKTLKDFEHDTVDCDIRNAVQAGYGTNKPVDNYEKNKAN